MKSAHITEVTTRRRYVFGRNVIADMERRKAAKRKQPKHKKSSPLLRKAVIDHKFMEPYFFDSENQFTIPGDVMPREVYQHATRLEEERVFDGGGNTLESLEKEIKVSSKIDANEVFKKGELFTLAKKLCQEQKKRFQEWVDRTFDFGYDTANNQMNVFKYCLGWRRVAVHVPPSILYKISEPSFPDELRTWLFEHGNLEKLTNGECKKLVKKFKDGGMPAITADIEQVNSARYAYRQVQYTIDVAQSNLTHTEISRVKIENRGARRPTMYFEDRFKTFEPVASEISNALYRIIKRHGEEMEIAIADARKKLEDKWKSFTEENM